MTKLERLEQEYNETIREVEYLYIVNEEVQSNELAEVIRKKEYKIQNLEIEIGDIRILERLRAEVVWDKEASELTDEELERERSVILQAWCWQAFEVPGLTEVEKQILSHKLIYDDMEMSIRKGYYNHGDTDGDIEDIITGNSEELLKELAERF